LTYAWQEAADRVQAPHARVNMCTFVLVKQVK
jgi:hypothetical protein